MDTSRLFKKNPHGSTRRPMSTVSQKLVAKSERPSSLASENPKSTLSLDYGSYIYLSSPFERSNQNEYCISSYSFLGTYSLF